MIDCYINTYVVFPLHVANIFLRFQFTCKVCIAASNFCIFIDFPLIKYTHTFSFIAVKFGSAKRFKLKLLVLKSQYYP